jgi:hypothetical protein
MKKTLRIEPVISTYRGCPERHGMPEVLDDGDWLDLEEGKEVTITRVGCRINKVEPEETYCMYYFLHAMRPGWKGDYQDGWIWDSFFTCSCGHGGCAGYHENVRIHRKKNTVRVAGKRRDGYTDGVVGTGDQVVYFDKADWDAVRAYYVDLFRKNPDAIFKDNDIYFTGRYGLATWG